MKRINKKKKMVFEHRERYKHKEGAYNEARFIFIAFEKGELHRITNDPSHEPKNLSPIIDPNPDDWMLAEEYDRIHQKPVALKDAYPKTHDIWDRVATFLRLEEKTPGQFYDQKGFRYALIINEDFKGFKLVAYPNGKRKI